MRIGKTLDLKEGEMRMLFVHSKTDIPLSIKFTLRNGQIIKKENEVEFRYLERFLRVNFPTGTKRFEKTPLGFLKQEVISVYDIMMDLEMYAVWENFAVTFKDTMGKGGKEIENLYLYRPDK
jgi:hypothetical protein